MKPLRKLSDIQSALQTGRLNMVALVDAYLKRIEDSSRFNIYLEVYAREAREKARDLDRKIREQPDQLGRLFGAVLSLKDVICHAGHRVEAASGILEGFTSSFSATAVERLLAEDAIIIGRVNCDEFAMGSSNESSRYGACQNPLDPTRVPGGSSGGSAASVAADTCLLSLGSDTGGSVRQPASFCGVIGLKPTYGRISRHGLLAYASSFDQIGILGHHAPDMALVLQLMAGPDAYDASAMQDAPPDYVAAMDFSKQQRVAWLDLPQAGGEVSRLMEAGKARMLELGHELEKVKLPLLDYLVPAYYIMTMAEASSNLSRYDGVRYGRRAENVESLTELYTRSRTEGFGPEVKKRIMLGTFVLSAGYYDAYYRKAQQVRRLLKNELDGIFSNYDLLMLPTTPGPAWKIGDMDDDPVQMYHADIFTVMANMAGLPAISIPMTTTREGLPMGLQLVAPAGAEGALLNIARKLTAS